MVFAFAAAALPSRRQGAADSLGARNGELRGEHAFLGCNERHRLFLTMSRARAIGDGAGVAITVEVLRRLKRACLKPRRTVRLVLWGSE